MGRSLVGLILLLSGAVLIAVSAPAYAVPVSDELIVTTPGGGFSTTTANPDPSVNGPGHFYVSSVGSFGLNLSLLGSPTGIFEDGTLVALVGICHVCNGGGAGLAFLVAGTVGLSTNDFDAAPPVFTHTVTDQFRTVDVNVYVLPGYTAQFIVGPDVAPVPTPRNPTSLRQRLSRIGLAQQAQTEVRSQLCTMMGR